MKSYPSIVVALALSLGGIISSPSSYQPEPVGSKHDILIVENETQPGATEENAEDSAKIGKEEGTHSGSNQGTKPESDTKKVEQPARRNVPTTNEAKPQ